MKQTAHIAILPSPGISHLIPFVEFARRLALHHGIHVTCIIPCSTDDHPPSDAKKAVLESLPKHNTHTIFLPPVNFDDLPSDTGPAAKIGLTVSRSLPSIQHVLKSLASSAAATPLVAAFADPFTIDALDTAKEVGLCSYVFFPMNAMCLSVFLHLPNLDEIASSYDFMEDLPEPVKLPGCPPLHGRDLFSAVQERRSDMYDKFMQMSKRLVVGEGIDGIVVNGFLDMESEVIKAMQEEKTSKSTIYPVGPIVQDGSTSQNDAESECLTWLDNQPRGSVLYVSFGSGGTLSYDQITELAFGLEMSEHRFIWTVRSPNNKSVDAAYLKPESQDLLGASHFFANGFLERTEGRGLVMLSWAPQARVLGHESTGGFLSHCGWSSTLESLVHGVPLIAWPLFAEQKMNAVLLVESLKVALRPKADEDGHIRREEIASVVKTLMDGNSEEGRIVRNHMKDLKGLADKALGKDGSCTKALSELASTLKNMIAK